MKNNNRIKNLNNPILKFIYPLDNKTNIGRLLNQKSGIYQWYNPFNGYSYVGMSSNLKRRFYEYFSDLKEKRYNEILAKSNRYILKDLKKDGINSFEFIVLDYVVADTKNDLGTNLLLSEQYYINNILPEYNILKRADSNKGINLSLNTRSKVSKGKTVYVYLLNVNNEPKSLAFIFNSLSVCSKFFKLSISNSSKLANNKKNNNTFIYLNNKYILSYKIII
jgi:group I intron endonuclease